MLAALSEPHPEPLWPLLFIRLLEERGSAEAFPVLRLGFPQGGVLISDTEVASETDPILRQLAAWPRNVVLGFDPLEHRLPLPVFVFDVDDPDDELQDELRGAQALGVYHAPATLTWALPPDVLASHMWPPVLTCVIRKWTTPRRDVVRLFVAHDHEWLRRPVLRHKVTRHDRPHAHPSALGKLYPVAFGLFDSRPSAGAAALPTLYVDTRTAERRFVGILGNAFRVLRARLNGALKVQGVDWQLAQETVAGIRTTGVKWLVDPGSNPIVTLDLIGLELVGDGNGLPIQTPAEVIRRTLANVAFAGYMSGEAWIGNDPSANLLDLKTLAEADDYLMASTYRPQGQTKNVASEDAGANHWTMGRRGTRYISTGVLALDWLNDTCRYLGIHPYWDEAGKIAFGILDHRTRRVFVDDVHWIREEDDVAQTFRQTDMKLRLRDEVRLGRLSVRDPRSPWSSHEVLPNRWSDGEAVEQDLVPFTTTDEPTAWTITGGETPNPAMTEPHQAIADPPYAPDEDRSRATWDAASATGTFRVRLRWAALPAMFQARAVPAVALQMRSRYVTNGGGTHTMKQGLRIGGTTYFGADRTLTTAWVDYIDIFETNPSTSNPWSLADLAPNVIEAEISATHVASQDKPEITQLFARATCVTSGPADVLERERASRQLLLSVRQPQLTEIEVGLHRAGIRPGDLVSVSHTAAKAAETRPGQTGWGTEPWERRPHFFVQRRFDLAARTAHMRLLDARDLIVPLWELDQARSSAPEADGVVRLGAWPGGRAGGPDGRRFSRPTDLDGDPTGVATVNDPNGDSVTLRQDTEKYTDASGLLIKRLDTAPTPDLQADTLLYLNRHDNQSWPIDSGGTAIFKIVPRNPAGGEILVVFRSGSDVVYFDGTGDLLIFRRTVGGTNYQTTLDLSASSWDQDRLVAIRWTSREQELVRVVDSETEGSVEESVPRFFLDIWAKDTANDPVKGIGVVAVEGFPGDLYVASDKGVNQLDAVIRGRRVWRSTLTDAEVEAEMRLMLP